MTNTRSMANYLSAHGRYGDDQLVHMNRHEVAALDGIAAAFGRNLTRNPHTGMKEAFNLFDILPIALNFIPGIGTAASIALSAASGAASAAVDDRDPLEGALMGGIGGALGAGLKGAPGLSEAQQFGVKAVPEAITPGAAGEVINGSLATPGINISMPTEAIGAPNMMSDIFGAGTDDAVQNALGSIWKKENIPYTLMGATALSSLPDMLGGGGMSRPEYGDIPENFPNAPRVVNPNYDPGMSAFGEQNAFSSGVDYLGRGYAEGGEVKKDNGFNLAGMFGGAIPMIIDGFTDGNKYGSGILGLLFNKRKPWEYGEDRGTNQQMANAPSAPAPMSAMNAPGFADGGSVSKPSMLRSMLWPQLSEQRIAEMPRFMSRLYQYGNRPSGGKGGVPMQAPFMQPRQRNIVAPDFTRMYASTNPLISPAPMTNVPLPGGNQVAPQLNLGPTVPPKGGDQPQINPGMAYGGLVRGYANGGMVDQAMQMDDRTVVQEAIMALSGQSGNPDAAIMAFVDRFGEDALQLLMQKMQGGSGGRYIEGPGDGLSDSIPATVDGQEPSALSSGVFVVPADAVSHLGNGSNTAGAKELYSMIDRLRQARTGQPEAPPAINQRGIMPA